MTSVSEAEALIAAHTPRYPNEELATDAARGRVLAQAVIAERDQPPFDRVTMDGIAINSTEWDKGQRQFRIRSVQAAGVAAGKLESADQCLQVMTGAVCPSGANAIVPIERLSIENGIAAIDPEAVVTAGQFIHRQGSDRQQGDTLLEPGIELGPAEIAILASAGYATVSVTRLPRVGIVSTGDELVAVSSDSLEPYQIRSCNDLAIAASLERARVATTERSTLPDDPAAILAQLEGLHQRCDMLILSGGVSMGEFDFVPEVLEALDCKPVFHRIRQKPGRPMWFGVTGDNKPVFALPGNPVSTLLCLTRFVLPAIRQAIGLKPAPPEYAALAEDISGPGKLTWFVPVILGQDQQFRSIARPRLTNTSGDFAALGATDGFLELPPGDDHRPAGTPGRVFRW